MCSINVASAVRLQGDKTFKMTLVTLQILKDINLNTAVSTRDTKMSFCFCLVK